MGSQRVREYDCEDLNTAMDKAYEYQDNGKKVSVSRQTDKSGYTVKVTDSDDDDGGGVDIARRW